MNLLLLAAAVTGMAPPLSYYPDAEPPAKALRAKLGETPFGQGPKVVLDAAAKAPTWKLPFLVPVAVTLLVRRNEAHLSLKCANQLSVAPAEGAGSGGYSDWRVCAFAPVIPRDAWAKLVDADWRAHTAGVLARFRKSAFPPADRALRSKMTVDDLMAGEISLAALREAAPTLGPRIDVLAHRLALALAARAAWWRHQGVRTVVLSARHLLPDRVGLRLTIEWFLGGMASVLASADGRTGCVNALRAVRLHEVLRTRVGSAARRTALHAIRTTCPAAVPEPGVAPPLLAYGVGLVRKELGKPADDPALAAAFAKVVRRLRSGSHRARQK